MTVESADTQDADGMELLVQHVESALKTQRHCFVRPEELQRVWPHVGEAHREEVVREFAQQHGWRVFSYNRGVGAMIVAEQPASLNSLDAQTSVESAKSV